MRCFKTQQRIPEEDKEYPPHPTITPNLHTSYIISKKILASYAIENLIITEDTELRKLIANTIIQGLISLKEEGKIKAEKADILTTLARTGLYFKLKNKHGYRYITRKIKETVGETDSALIYRWTKQLVNPLGRLNKIHVGPQLAYTAAAWFGDGEKAIRQRQQAYLISLKTKDKEFAETFAQKIAQVTNTKTWKPVKTKQGQWRATRCSILLYALFSEYRKKPESMLPLALKWPAEFVRGAADAEGSVINDPKSRTYRIIIYNTDKKFLEIISTALKKLSIGSKIRDMGLTRGRKPYYALRIEGKENRRKFVRLIGFSILRKSKKASKWM